MRPFGRLPVAALACLLAAWSGGRAAAHSVLLGTEPADGTILDQRPETVRLRFNEPVTPVVVRVLDRTGTEITGKDDVEAVGSGVEIRLPPDLAEGSYIVTWRVVSADSHPIGESFRFSYGQAGPGATIEDPGLRETVWESASIVNRALFYGIVLAACGGALFLLGFQRTGAAATVQRLTWLTAFALVPTALSIPIEGGRLYAADLSAFTGAELWQAALASTIGRSVLVAAVGLGLLLAGLRARDRLGGPPAMIAGSLIAIGSLALTGHAATADPRPLMSWTVFIHALAVAFWFGALWPLLASLRFLGPKEAAELMRRFSEIAMAVVGLLVVAGTTLAVVQVATPEGLVETSYGRIFLLKLALVITVVLVALANRQRLTPRLAAGDDDARRALDRNIRIEIGVISLGFLVTSVLGHVTPPRALAAMESMPAAHAHQHTEDAERPLAMTVTRRGYTAEISLASRKAGHNRLDVSIRDSSGRILTPLEIEARFSMPAKGIEPSTRKLARHGDHWRIDTTDLGLPGRWMIRVDVLVNDFEKVMFEAEATLE